MKYLQNMNHLWKTWWFGCKNTIVTAFILSVYTKLVNGAPQQQHHQQGCGHEELVRCAERLHVISDTKELSFVQSKAELDQVCPDMHKGILCIHSYTRRCMTLSQRDHFHALYRGTATVIKDLCKEGPYQEEFLRHLPCMRTRAKEYESCTHDYQKALQLLDQPPTRNDTNDNETIKNVCCSFQQYIDCGTRTMRECGEEAAQFTRSFMDRMSSNLIKIHCMEYSEERCLSSSSTSVSSNFVTISALFAALFVMLRNHLLIS